ncbi:MAG TPA: CehA/McbA family metallohydrolase [Mycobacteriales bacterium]|nr:CehA/McbA family metallohydrolase [Mycobacteriales bacterium]
MRGARLIFGIAVAAALTLTVPAAAAHHSPVTAPHGYWIPGDLHVHTIYGHDTCITPTTAWDYTKPSLAARRPCADSYTWGFPPADRLNEARQRGLGFVAITDHNNVMNQTDPAVLAWQKAHPDFVSIPGYENSQAGHVQMLGARSCYGNHGPIRHQLVECDAAPKDKSVHGMRELANGLRRNGGVFQINHPSDLNWLHAYRREVVPDTIEVWNIGPWAFQHPLPSANDNNFSLRWYDGFLQRGDEIAATGGSDSHWRLTDSVQGIGDPTTWVYVTHRTIQGVLDGLRAHHTFVSDLPPSQLGAQMYLEADAHHDGHYEAIAGSETTAGAAYRVRTINALPGSVVRITTDKGTVLVDLPPSGTLTFRPGTAGVPKASVYVRAELLEPDGRQLRTDTCDKVIGSQTTLCRDDLLMESLTTPIFIR